VGTVKVTAWLVPVTPLTVMSAGHEMLGGSATGVGPGPGPGVLLPQATSRPAPTTMAKRRLGIKGIPKCKLTPP